MENVSRFDGRCVHSQWIPQGLALGLEGWPDWVPVLRCDHESIVRID